MKKTYFSILILSLLLACLTACGAQAKQPDEPEPAPQVDQIEPTQPEQPTEPAPEPIADIEPIAEPEPIAAVEPEPEPAPENPLTFTDCNETAYAISTVNLRSGPSTDYEKVGSLSTGDSVTRVGIGTGTAENWSQIQLSDGTLVCVSSKYLSTTKPTAQAPSTPSSGGRNNGQTSAPSGGSSSTSSSTSEAEQWAAQNGQGLSALLGYTGGVQFEDEDAAADRFNDPSLRVNMG